MSFLSLQDCLAYLLNGCLRICRYLLLSLSEGCEPTNRLYYVDMSQLSRINKTGALDFTLYDRR